VIIALNIVRIVISRLPAYQTGRRIDTNRRRLAFARATGVVDGLNFGSGKGAVVDREFVNDPKEERTWAIIEMVVVTNTYRI